MVGACNFPMHCSPLTVQVSGEASGVQVLGQMLGSGPDTDTSIGIGTTLINSANQYFRIISDNNFFGIIGGNH